MKAIDMEIPEGEPGHSEIVKIIALSGKRVTYLANRGEVNTLKSHVQPLGIPRATRRQLGWHA